MEHNTNSPCSSTINEQCTNVTLKRADEKIASENKKESTQQQASCSGVNSQHNASTYSLSEIHHMYNNCFNGTANGNSSTNIPPPHFYSPILGSQQTLLRPLMTAQPPLYSPILASQQHSYALPHPSPPAGCFSSLSESVRNGGIDMLNCNASATLHSPRKNLSSLISKACDLQDVQFANEHKKNNNENICNSSQVATCSELLKTSNNNGLHEQRMFDEYARLIGEEASCKSWSDSSMCTPSSNSHYKTNTTNSFPSNQNFPDCRLDTSWDRNPVSAVHESCFISENQIMNNNSKESLKISSHNTDSEGGRTQYEHQSFTGPLLSYLQHSAYQGQENRMERRQPESCDITKRQQRTAETMNNSCNKKVVTADSFNRGYPQQKPSSGTNAHNIQCNNTATMNTSLPLTENMLPNISQTTVAQTSVYNSLQHHQNHNQLQTNINGAQQSLRNRSSDLHQSGHQSSSTQQTLSAHESITSNSLSSTAISASQVHSLSHNFNMNNRVSNQGLLNPNNQVQYSDSTHLSNSRMNSNHRHCAVLATHFKQSSNVNAHMPTELQAKMNTQQAVQSVHINEHSSKQTHSQSVVHLSSQMEGRVNSYNSSNNVNLQAVNTFLSHDNSQVLSSQSTMGNPHSQIVQNDMNTTGKVTHSQAVLPNSNCQMRKLQRNPLNRYTSTEGSKKDNSEGTMNNNPQNEIHCENFCLICGTAVDISSHCSVDALLAVTNKVTVAEKLSFLLGHSLSREALPSLAVCPKCFEVVSELDTLENRLNVCRKEILNSLVGTFERNGVQLYLNKRMQSQHYSSYGNDNQHSQYAVNQGGGMAVYQNDQHYHHVGQNYFNSNNHNIMEQNMHYFHGNLNMTFQDDAQTNHSPVNMHTGLQNSDQIHHQTNQLQMQEVQQHTSQQAHQEHQKSQHSLIHMTKNQGQNKPHSHQHGHQPTMSHTQHNMGNISENSNGLSLSQVHVGHRQNNIGSLSGHEQQTFSEPKDQQPFHSQQLTQNPMQQGDCILQQNNIQQMIVYCQKDPEPIPLQKSSKIQNSITDIKTERREALNEMGETSHKSQNKGKQEQPKALSTSGTFPKENIIRSSSVSILLNESSEQQIDQNALSVFLPNYPSSQELLVDHQEYTDEELSNIGNKENMKEQPCTADHSGSSENTWTESCDTSDIIDSIQVDVGNNTECDIDIEKCDINEEILTEVEEENNSAEDTVIQTSSLSDTGEPPPHLPMPASEVKLQTEACPSSSEEPVEASSAPQSPALLSPPSLPPPPVAPPEGLRNVQDATEYRKPTLLGKNLKGKKHAKLQICRQCDQVFSNRQALIRHIERRHKSSNLTFSCDTCHRKFNSERTLSHHVLSHKAYPCDLCDKIFLKKAKLKEHLVQHPKQTLKCDICDKEIKSVQALRSHVKTHNKNPQTFKCSICSVSFTCKRNLEHHKRLHTGEKPFSCQNCKKTFRYKCNMKAHYILCSGKFKYSCLTCNKGFAYQSLYKRHLLEHEDKYAHRCSVCKKGFSRSSDLRNHFITHKDTKPNTYPCAICRSNSSACCNSRPLAVDRSSVCQICGKVVSIKNAMKDHLAKHNGIRNHKCKYCSRTFFYRSNLYSHVQSVHLQKKPHRCVDCGKVFAVAHNLKIHARSHTGERPYQCKSCGKTFSCKSNYRRHQKCHLTRWEMEESENEDPS